MILALRINKYNLFEQTFMQNHNVVINNLVT